MLVDAFIALCHMAYGATLYRTYLYYNAQHDRALIMPIQLIKLGVWRDTD